ncbi:MAG: two-component system, chemotaxis family, CheB/CheR fusion protein, partial [Verrucomicrobiota bacterium]
MPEKVEKDIEADNSEDPRSGERTATSANALRILLVEDHNDTRGVFANLLNRSGYLVSVADSVKSAVALLGIRKFDVLLSDLGLPDGSGYALLAQA